VARGAVGDRRTEAGRATDALIFAYLFDHPEYLYHPGEKTTERSWTRSPVAGNKLADKAVYVLTSDRTASGAEQFSYNMKMLRRGTLVGETTHGVAHARFFGGSMNILAWGFRSSAESILIRSEIGRESEWSRM
jgi:hypothetical protein